MVELSPNQKRVFEVIKTGRLATIEEIAAEAGLHPNYCGNIIAILRRLGLIEKVWMIRARSVRSGRFEREE